ncbi:MAG: UDP-2,4-diacetamido-2,4,6-trideoxy-beta-L-altropyranose hydrolase [Lachnospiraceae bacterium]
MELTGKKYFFRVDGNAKIGVGHIMRSLTIASALTIYCKKEEICFVCANQQSADVIEKQGYDVLVLHTNYLYMDEELELWEKIGKKDIKILVDSYYITPFYLKSLKKYGMVYILDDMQEEKYDVDVVINYNIFANQELYKRMYKTLEHCFLGEKYVPIRQQFCGVEYMVQDLVKNVFITTGGGDIFNIAGKIYLCLSECHKELTFHLISGVYNPYFEELKKIEEKNKNLKVYHDVSNMADIMKKCDIAITAGGSTIYELSSIGVPLICFSYAKNQEQLVEYFGAHVSDYAGAYDKKPEKMLQNMKDIFCNKFMDKSYRECCSKNEKQLIDGNGASRIAKLLFER